MPGFCDLITSLLQYDVIERKCEKAGTPFCTAHARIDMQDSACASQNGSRRMGGKKTNETGGADIKYRKFSV